MTKRAKAEKAPTKADAPAQVDLNTASVVLLTTVKGIGQGRAESIARHRDKNGPFASVDDLDRVEHVGDMPPDELKELKTHLMVQLSAEIAPPTAPEAPKVNVNKAGIEELRSVDGIGYERAEEIIAYREEHGKIRDLNELDELPHFKDEPEGQRQPIKAKLRV